MQRLAALFVSGIALLAMLVTGGAIAKDGIIEINGVVQARPVGLVGDWTIAGRAVRTDGATVFSQQIGPANVGAVVEVKGTLAADSALLAQRIEVKQAASTSQPPVGPADSEVTGSVQALPAIGLVGAWKVAGRTVVVLSTTRIDQEHGGVQVGSIVEAKGSLNPDRSIAASSVEVKSGGTPTPNPATPSMEIQGQIDALPVTGLLGTWTVAGRAFVVDAATVLNSEHGTFVVGAPVEVHAAKQLGGQLVATRIERTRGIGATVPASRFWGRITLLPPAGFVGVWKIDNSITVDVSPSTQIHVNNGPIVINAIVEVAGWPQPDGVIAAREIETRSVIGEMSAQGPTVVEFRNARLGHYFITSSPAEIALLDGGAFNGEWVRTGETFRTGGTQAVCRFYGMPPRGPDSHFFTSNATECGHVMGTFAAWTFEDHAFAITPTTSGQCPVGLLPVHRFFNNPLRASEMNHRFTVTTQAFNDTIAMGWIHEGVVMCAQP